jgi:hypothetical protein
LHFWSLLRTFVTLPTQPPGLFGGGRPVPRGARLCGAEDAEDLATADRSDRVYRCAVTAPHSDLVSSAGGSRKGLEAYLRARTQEELVELLLSAATDDEKLENRLSLTAADAAGDVASLAEQVDAVLGDPGWLDYRGAIDFANEGSDLVDALKRAAASPANDQGEVTCIVEDAIIHVASALRYRRTTSRAHRDPRPGELRRASRGRGRGWAVEPDSARSPCSSGIPGARRARAGVALRRRRRRSVDRGNDRQERHLGQGHHAATRQAAGGDGSGRRGPPI